MRRIVIGVLLLAVAITAIAKRDESYEELKARAAAAKQSDQGKLFAQVSRRAVEVANSFYGAGKLPEAHAAVQEVVSYAEKARTAAQNSGKNLKQTEIELREAARRLEEVRRSLALEDRPYVEAAVNRVEQVRRDLLDQMFGLKPREKEKK